jgi:hypothetical protein
VHAVVAAEGDALTPIEHVLVRVLVAAILRELERARGEERRAS